MQGSEFESPTDEQLAALNDALAAIGVSPWFAAVSAAIIGGALVFWIYYRRTGASRDKEIRAAADAAGCRYAPADPEISRLRMALFGGEGPSIDNVVIKSSDYGTDVRAFEFVRSRLVTRTVNDQGALGEVRTTQIRQHLGGRRTAGVAKIPAYLPRMVITTDKLSRKLLDLVGAADIELESDEFNRLFDVRTEDRNFAHAFLDARMIDFMIQTDGAVDFETFGQWILLCLDRVTPVEMPAVCNLVATFKSNVPNLILTDFMLPSERESVAQPPAGFERSHDANAWSTQ